MSFNSAQNALQLRRHAPGSVKVHLRYGRLTMDDVKEACDRAGAKNKAYKQGKKKWADCTTNELLLEKKAIECELVKRKKQKK